MSIQTRNRLLLVCLAFLVCGVFAIVVRKPAVSPGLVSTLEGFETNYGLVTANIVVSNPSPRACEVTVAEGGGMKVLPARRSGTWKVQLSSPNQRHLQIICTPANTGKLYDQLRRIFKKPEVYSLDLPQ